ncbi:hypothetical protein BU24DRAFT_417198 [Aaosphaeria arxii CBS 175.79]|uniref:Secreted protein n=1 Tax=Aaosphaeria arxii CBS 175.79 TaxID=1450172 RepID=A0A6A5Y8B2_9PLEO|nr:uncharacterized protein BU24DRAFT_417198 [Aaosphaeria arxii CBS 175.79]KAF2021556.1 hypothetical protein BU24DRAFT_417198 [Aaosphaeria arxii CBS 175.79]
MFVLGLAQALRLRFLAPAFSILAPFVVRPSHTHNGFMPGWSNPKDWIRYVYSCFQKVTGPHIRSQAMRLP